MVGIFRTGLKPGSFEGVVIWTIVLGFIFLFARIPRLRPPTLRRDRTNGPSTAGAQTEPWVLDVCNDLSGGRGADETQPNERAMAQARRSHQVVSPQRCLSPTYSSRPHSLDRRPW